MRKALEEAGRTDLIGSCDALIPAHPPKEVLQAQGERVNRTMRDDHIHTVPNLGREGRSKIKSGYRPNRKTAKRQERS